MRGKERSLAAEEFMSQLSSQYQRSSSPTLISPHRRSGELRKPYSIDYHQQFTAPPPSQKRKAVYLSYSCRGSRAQHQYLCMRLQWLLHDRWHHNSRCACSRKTSHGNRGRQIKMRVAVMTSQPAPPLWTSALWDPSSQHMNPGGVWGGNLLKPQQSHSCPQNPDLLFPKKWKHMYPYYNLSIQVHGNIIYNKQKIGTTMERSIKQRADKQSMTYARNGTLNQS